MLISTLSKWNLKISIYDSINSDLELEINNYPDKNLKISYLKLIEHTTQKDLSFRYVLIRDEQKNLKAFLYYQLLTFNHRNLTIKGNIFLRIIATLFLKIRPFKILISGNLFAVNFPVIKFDSSVLSSSQILDLISEAENMYKSDVLMIKDLDDSFNYSELVARGFEKYESDLTMSMNIRKEWKSFEDYKNILKKKYRKRAENIRLAGKSLIRKTLNAEEIKQQTKRIMELFMNVSDRQPIRMGQIENNYFYEYKKRFPDKFQFAGFYQNEKLVSFVTYVDHNEILEVHYIGIDYSLNNSLKLYFNLLFDALETGITLNKEQIELGRTAREAKAILGASPVYFNDYIRYNSKLSVLLSRYISRLFQNKIGENWAFRSPFIETESN